MFIVKNDLQEPLRVVELEQNGDPYGVRLLINGRVVLRLDDDCDLIVMVGGITKETTGLQDFSGHAQCVWDTDKATSLRVNGLGADCTGN